MTLVPRRVVRRGFHRAAPLSALAAVLVVCSSLVLTTPSAAVPSAADQISVVVVPHPDDEFQAWSLIENSPDNFKVFVVATTGEQSVFCEPDRLEVGLQAELGEVPPDPVPTGRWTTSCADARMNSMLAFLASMSVTDPSVPGSWGAPRDHGPFAADGAQLCRTDEEGAETCSAKQRTARVWLDTAGRGAVVSWDLGDGDLTASEVSWAMETTIAQRAALGLPSELPVHNILGSYSNLDGACYAYAHADHRAVHEALWSTTIPAVYRAAATCHADPDASRSASVTAETSEAAFRVEDDGRRVGSHARHYGWLHSSHYELDLIGQDQVFHTNQWFWVRWQEELAGPPAGA